MPRAQSQLLLPCLACGRTEPCLKSVHLLSSLAHVKIQREAAPGRTREQKKIGAVCEWGGREGGGEREPPDHSTKTWIRADSFKPPAKQRSAARYATSGQTVVNHSALHKPRARSLTGSGGGTQPFPIGVKDRHESLRRPLIKCRGIA